MTLLIYLVLLAAAAPATSSAAPSQGGNLAAASPPARFQGTLEMRMTMEGGAGTLLLLVGNGKARLRIDAVSSAMKEPVRLDFISDDQAPDRITVLDNRRKVRREVSMAEAANLADAGLDKGKYRVKVLGQEKILGYACAHVALTRDKELVDACVSSDFMDVYGVLRKLQASDPRPGVAGMFAALEAAGHAGLPLRYTVIREGQKVTTLVTKVERRPPADSAFAVPKDYRPDAGAPADRSGPVETSKAP